MNNLLRMPYWDLLDEARFLANRYPIDSIEVATNRLSTLLINNNYEVDPVQGAAAIAESRINRRPV